MEGIVISWWMWFLFGLLLLLLEFFTPGAFYQFFFGLAAVVVGLLSLLGLQPPFWIQMLLFLGVAVGSLLLLRKRLKLKFDGTLPDSEVDTMKGETAVALEDIAPGAIGKAELRGSTWDAHNVGDAFVSRSQRCRVERVDGLTLQIRS